MAGVSLLLLLLLFSFSSAAPSSFNLRLQKAYIALQALKHSIVSDPGDVTGNWYGPYVCNYTGVFCAPAPDDPSELTVAGIDLNHANISGVLPEDLGLLSDLALLHLNTNRFTGTIPATFCDLPLLYELDVSNNLLSSPFPSVVLRLPSLRYLDLRFNFFYGEVPPEVFELKLDALFINDNQFRFTLPSAIGSSTVSVLVMANNKLDGCLPPTIGDMAATLNEIILLNSGISSCLPPQVGRLGNLTVFDISFNGFKGPLPESFAGLKSIEQLDVAHNQLSGDIPEAVCDLPRLRNFTYSYNFFDGEPQQCLGIKKVDDRRNCIPSRPLQRSLEECSDFLSNPVFCNGNGCFAPPPPPPPSPPPPSPPPPCETPPPPPPYY